MTTVPLLYRAAVRAVRVSSPLLGLGGGKVARGILGRRTAVDTLVHWGDREREPGLPAVWMHAPSVGEGLQAGAVLRVLTERRPGLQVVFTHFSPSAEGLGDRIGADVSAYLPWDVRQDVRRVLKALRPSLLAFTKTEVWPVLVEESTSSSVPPVIVAATVPDGAGRMRWPARSVLRQTWARMAVACAVDGEDAERLMGMGVSADAVHVTGDPGIDSAALRVSRADPDAPWLSPFHAAARPTLVAGSTWPADEDVLAPAWVAVLKGRPEAMLVLAPHEPTSKRVAALLARFRGLGLTSVTLAAVERAGAVGGAHVVVVDRVGVLAELYTVGSAAYVGGGFGRNGLHSVLEPAAAGIPSAFGPSFRNARAAGQLVELGAARSVPDPTALADAVGTWLDQGIANREAADRALDYIRAHRGASDRTAELLDPLIGVTARA
jgi:3-deoxy-D-manno-octulosonic-acid transferase